MTLEQLLKTLQEPSEMDAEDIVYPLDKLCSAATEVEVLEGGLCFLCLYQTDEQWLDYGLFEQICSDEGGNNAKVQIIFHGGGPGTLKEGEFSLREFRHTYFGDEGYYFYLPIKSTIQALQILSKYFN